MKKRVAILYICTGEYSIFWRDFFISCEKYFLPKSHLEYFVFTDSEEIYSDDNGRVHLIKREFLGWPLDTMMRFDTFLLVEEELKEFDFVFFFNANCLCVDYILEEDFLPKDDGLLVIRHPGFWDKNCDEFSYDRNKKCTAYIPYGEGRYYVCGGLNGGTAQAYIAMCHELSIRTKMDLKKKVIPLWHDESQLNKYITEGVKFETRDPGYWYPEGWDIPFEKKIIVRDKSKWIDIDRIKYHRPSIKDYIWHIVERIMSAVEK